MVISKSTASPNPSVYRVDVVRCEAVAKFDTEEHAAFLVELLLKEQANG